MSVTLLHGDCLTLLPTLAAGSVDLVLADLPYGTTNAPWDCALPLDVLWAEYKRVLAPGGAVVLTASQPFTSILVTSNLKWFRCEWVWKKSKATGYLDAKRKPLKAHESVLVFAPRRPIYHPQKWRVDPQFIDRRKALACKSNTSAIYQAKTSKPTRQPDDGTRYPLSVVTIPSIWRRGMHATEKPEALGEYFILTYSNPGDTVLDNTMGVGPFGVAAVNTGRNFIGMELDPEHFASARARITAAQTMPQQAAWQGVAI
jgi:DNA modification methylase